MMPVTDLDEAKATIERLEAENEAFEREVSRLKAAAIYPRVQDRVRQVMKDLQNSRFPRSARIVRGAFL